MDARIEILQGLVDREDLDALFALVSVDEVAQTWCRYQHNRPLKPDLDEDENWWAVDLFFTRGIFRRVDTYRSILLSLVRHASDETLGNVGAGPLENFVSDDEDDLEWLERECRTNDRLRRALATVWCDDCVTPATLARLDAAAGVKLARSQKTPPSVS